jgi:hypothetical protein
MSEYILRFAKVHDIFILQTSAICIRRLTPVCQGYLSPRTLSCMVGIYDGVVMDYAKRVAGRVADNIRVVEGRYILNIIKRHFEHAAARGNWS